MEIITISIGVPMLVAVGYWLCWRKHQKVITTAKQQAELLDQAVQAWGRMENGKL